MELYTYYRSTSSYRVRIALALKGLAYQSVPVNLLQGEQRGSGYVAVNPQGRVPALRTDGGELLVQSPAIIEYLEEVYPQPALLPSAAEARAKVRGLADVYLIPQLYAAERFNIDLDSFPRILRVAALAAEHAAFAQAHPALQPDSPAQ